MYKVEADAAKILPPCNGAMVVVAVTSTPVVIDLTSIPGHPCMGGGVTQPDNTNPINHYLRITAQGANDIYFIFADTYAHANSVSASATSTVSGTGVVTVAGTESDYIPAGSYKDVIPLGHGTMQAQNPKGANSKARFLGLVTSTGSANARIYQSGP